MAQYAGGGGGTFTPPATGSLRTPGPRKLVPPSRLQDFLHTAAPNSAPLMLRPRSPEQPQPQQYGPFVTPAVLPKPIDFSSWAPRTELFPQQKPLSVQVVPQQQPVAIQAQPLADGGWMDGTFPVSPWVVDEQVAAQKVVDDKNEKIKHDARIVDRKAYEAADQTETAQAMTPKQWASLSPLKQAAAQSNYDLSLAVKKDFESQGKNKSTEAQTKVYNDRVKELFGDQEFLNYKGLNFAPNTIAFLDERGVKAADLAGHTLDDLLSGKALSTADTFNSLEEQVAPLPPGPNGLVDVRGKNIQFAQTLAKGQLSYQEGLATKLKQGSALLTDITSASTNSAANKSYGALQQPTRTSLTDVRPETVAQFDMYMEALARTDSPIDQALEAISLDLGQRGASPKETEQVWQGLIERSRQATTGEGKWFDGLDFPMRSPVEVAQALGAPTLKRQATLGEK